MQCFARKLAVRTIPILPRTLKCRGTYKIISPCLCCLKDSTESPRIPVGSNTAIPSGNKEILLYKWKTMKHFRFISKFKIYQVTFMLAMLPPATYWYSVDRLTGTALGYGGVALLGTASVLAIISHYFSKLVGELNYKPESESIRISTLTFWGNRIEEEFQAADIITFVESQTRMGGAFQKLQVKGCDKVYVWSMNYGNVKDLDLLCKVLKISRTDLSHF